MTIGELIEILSKLDKDKRVLVSGYEGGYEDPTVSSDLLEVVPYDGGFCGSYETPDLAYDENGNSTDPKDNFYAYIIRRY